ncbi:MAG: TrkA family potassium uptake protein [Acidobacteria bacterium]|nr:TrkA family potassium uptake protein [Acidobacteriota bacterium]
MKQYAVIGLGSFGMKVARTLAERGAEVIAIDEDIKKVEEIKDVVSQAICLDSTNEELMRAAGLEDVEAAVVGTGENVEASILTTAVLHRLNVPRIVARAASPLHSQILERVGATRIINVEEQMGEQVAKGILAPEIHEQIPLASGHSLVEVAPKRDFLGRTIGEINFRAKYGVNIIAVQKRNPIVTDRGESGFEVRINDLPRPEDVIEANDILVVVGSDENIERLTGGES